MLQVPVQVGRKRKNPLSQNSDYEKLGFFTAGVTPKCQMTKSFKKTEECSSEYEFQTANDSILDQDSLFDEINQVGQCKRQRVSFEPQLNNGK